MVATYYMWPNLNHNKIKLKIQFFRHTSHISRVQYPHAASGYHIGQFRYVTFPSWQKVLLGGAVQRYSLTASFHLIPYQNGAGGQSRPHRTHQAHHQTNCGHMCGSLELILKGVTFLDKSGHLVD